MATIFPLAVLRARSFARFDRFLPVVLNNNNIKQSIKYSNISRYCFTSHNAVTKTTDVNNTDGSAESTKKNEEIKVTLLLPDNNVMVTDLENATKISKRRNLVLVKVEDVQKKTGRPLYKLISQNKLLQELGDNENEQKNTIKNMKTIQISSKITLYDLNVKLKNVTKLLEKKHKVKIIIVQGSNIQDKVFKTIENSVKYHGTIQKTVKSTSMIFTITPSSNVNNNDESCGIEEKK